MGLTQQNVAQSILISLSGSFQTAPNFYLDPRNGVSYSIATQTPQYRLDSMAELQSLPISGSTTGQGSTNYVTSGGSVTTAGSAMPPGTARPVQVLGNLAGIQPGTEIGEVSHYDIQPVIESVLGLRADDPD